MASPANAVFNSLLAIDNITQVISGSISAPANTTIGSTTSLGVNDLVFFTGIYNIDGGNYVDLGASVLIGNQLNFFVQTIAYSNQGSLTVSANNSDNASHVVGYKIAVIAKPSNTLLTYDRSKTPLNTTTISSLDNVPKIYLDNSMPVTVAANTSTAITIPHNLGYIPMIRLFLTDSFGSQLADALAPQAMVNITGQNIPINTAIDLNNITVTWTNVGASVFNVVLHYRVYYDSN